MKTPKQVLAGIDQLTPEQRVEAHYLLLMAPLLMSFKASRRKRRKR